MKKIWMILSTLAIANVLAIGGFVAWLQATDRLDKERFESVRQMFKVTLAQEKQAKTEELMNAAAEATKAAADAKDALPPETATEKIAEKQLQAEKDLQLVLRKQQELENLRGFLLKQLADLERREGLLTAQRLAFESERKKIAETEGAAQFKTALATLEAQKPKDAKAVLKALIDSKNADQVISYLAKMDEGKRGKVIAEFVKDEPAVAAELLEKIRTRGLTPSAIAAANGVAGSTEGMAVADDASTQPN